MGDEVANWRQCKLCAELFSIIEVQARSAIDLLLVGHHGVLVRGVTPSVDDCGNFLMASDPFKPGFGHDVVFISHGNTGTSLQLVE